jgi:hypothetical protein
LDCSILLRFAAHSTVAYYVSTTSAFANQLFSSAKRRWSWGLWGVPLEGLLLLPEPLLFEQQVRGAWWLWGFFLCGGLGPWPVWGRSLRIMRV